MPVIINGTTGISGVDGSAGTPAFQGSDANTGIRFGTDIVSLVTGGSDRLYIDSSGRLGVGTSSPSETLTVSGKVQATTEFKSESGNDLRLNAGSVNRDIFMQVNGSTLMTVQGSTGRVGIGTTSPGEALTVGTGNAQVTSGQLTVGVTSTSGLQFINDGTFGTLNSIPLIFRTVSSERARIDTSGRLLVGTSTDLGGGISNRKLQVASDNGGFAVLSRDDSSIVSGDAIGAIEFIGRHGGNTGRAADIFVYADADHGTNDYPGRLVFSTTADGASSPTERMRIDSTGAVKITGSTTNNAASAIELKNSASTELFRVRNDGVIYTGGATYSPYNNTTASAANVFVASFGDLYRSTSSVRFKTDIETLQPEYADAILNVRPVWYRSLCKGDNPDWGYWGFIAEEVAEIDPRLVFWKTHETEKDEDGNTVQVELDEPIAESVQYDRFVPHLLNLIKRQGEAIAELQAEVAALKGA